MNELFLKIINMSISASWLILAVLILRLVLKKAPKWVNVLLWGIVAVRLICPLSFESALILSQVQKQFRWILKYGGQTHNRQRCSGDQ